MSIGPIFVNAQGKRYQFPATAIQNAAKPPGPTIPASGLGWTLPDDFLPPATLNHLSDAELRTMPELWPFDEFREHRKAPRTNLPATVTTVKKGTFVHNATVLRYWADNCALAWYGVMDHTKLSPANRLNFNKKWEWLTKGTEVITNGHSREEGYYDPVLGVNAGAPPIGIEALFMEQNVFKPLSTSPRRYGGVTGYLFETLDGEMGEYDMESCNCFTHPWLWPRANILMGPQQRDSFGEWYTYLPNGRLGLDPFPQGWDGSLDAITPLPSVCRSRSFGGYVMDAKTNLIPMNRVQLVEGELGILYEIPNPYNPQRDLN